MDAKLKALVLSTTKYGDNGIVLRCLTDLHGVQAYMIKGMRSKTAKVKPGMILPLTQLNLIATHRDKGFLEHIKEAGVALHYQSIHTNPIKSALSSFIAEITNRVLRDTDEGDVMFNLLCYLLNDLDSREDKLGYFPIEFLLHVLDALGWFPDLDSYRKGRWLDLREGECVDTVPMHGQFLDQESTEHLFSWYENLRSESPSNCPSEIRRRILDGLLKFMQIHHDGFGEVKSLEIVRELLY